MRAEEPVHLPDAGARARQTGRDQDHVPDDDEEGEAQSGEAADPGETRGGRGGPRLVT